MSLLLDTHAFVWFLEGNPKLSTRAAKAIGAEAKVALSIASVWELAIKRSLDKLDLLDPLPEMLSRARDEESIDLLAVTLDDAFAVAGLPFHHRDPFDRMLVAQAIRRDWTLVTLDSKFAAYGVKTLW